MKYITKIVARFLSNINVKIQKLNSHPVNFSNLGAKFLRYIRLHLQPQANIFMLQSQQLVHRWVFEAVSGNFLDVYKEPTLQITNLKNLKPLVTMLNYTITPRRT